MIFATCGSVNLEYCHVLGPTSHAFTSWLMSPRNKSGVNGVEQDYELDA